MRFISLLLISLIFGLPAHAEQLSFGGGSRTYELYRPATQSAGGQRVPLMVVLHETGGTAVRLRRSLGMDALAQRQGFAVAYPEALNGNWNDGRHGSGPQRQQPGGDDVGFLRALVQQLAARGIGSATDAAVVGIDGGGMMVYRLACEASGTFSAYIALLANMPTALRDVCQPAAASRMMIMVATEDAKMPFAGGKLPTMTGIVQSADQTFQYWGQANRCSAGGVVDLPDLDKTDGTRVEMLTTENCAPRAETTFYRIIGGGHQLPTRPVVPRPLDRGSGKGNHDVDAVELAFRFASGQR